MPYDPTKRNGWARGLIHFHTDFSDGGATVFKAADIAKRHDYDFLIVTDHLQNLPRQGRRFDEYVHACQDATSPELLVIPGGEIELDWTRGIDHSQAHTLAMAIQPLLADLVWDPHTKPYAHWQDSGGHKETILAVQEKLRDSGLPPAASHMFQHAYLSDPAHPDEHADFRYDLARTETARLLDFFYSGVIEAAHEPEDFALYLSRLRNPPGQLPGVYASCDYHYGPEVLRELLHQHKDEIIGGLCGVLTKWRRFIGVPVCWFLRWQPRFGLGILERWAPRLLGLFKEIAPLQFAAEQLSHATYVYIGGGPLTEDRVIRSLSEGRTCVTRGAAEFSDLQPIPSGTPVPVSRVEIHLHLPQTYSVHRPRSILIYRDGLLVNWETVPDEQQLIDLTWTDPSPLRGFHSYTLYIPSKFLASPIVVDLQ